MEIFEIAAHSDIEHSPNFVTRAMNGASKRLGRLNAQSSALLKETHYLRKDSIRILKETLPTNEANHRTRNN